MADILPQYSGFLNTPQNQTGGQSPLQLAAAYYMTEGQQIPFFINHDWLRALRVYCDSGIVDPKTVGGTGPVVVKNDDVYTIEPAADCGPDEKNRTELVYRGKIQNLPIEVWRSGIDGVIRGGSAANGVGGQWGTGGIVSPSPDPGNSVGTPEPTVSNVSAAYSVSTATAAIIKDNIENPQSQSVSVQGIG